MLLCTILLLKLQQLRGAFAACELDRCRLFRKEGIILLLITAYLVEFSFMAAKIRFYCCEFTRTAASNLIRAA